MAARLFLVGCLAFAMAAASPVLTEGHDHAGEVEQAGSHGKFDMGVLGQLRRSLQYSDKHQCQDTGENCGTFVAIIVVPLLAFFGFLGFMVWYCFYKKR